MSTSRAPSNRTGPRRPAVAVLLVAAVAVPALAGKPGDVVGSRHDLSIAGGSSSRATSETQPCVFCHTPHAADPAPQLWNHQVSAANYGTYGSSTFQSGSAGGVYNTFAGTTAPQPSGSARLCLSCHDGTIALGATLRNGTISMSGSGFVPPTASLGTDLSNDHPVSFRRSGSVTDVVDPPSADPVALETATRYVQCVSCHDPHTEATDPTTRKFLVKANRGSAVCVTCHKPSGPGWSWGTSAHATSTASYTSASTGGAAGLGAHTGYATVADNGCEACHRPHTAPQAQRLLKAVNQRDLCFQCHGSTPVARKSLAPVFGKPYRHSLETSTTTILHDAAELKASATNFSGARRHVDCVDCHDPHASGAGLHQPGTNTITAVGVLAGATGVEPAAWPAVLPSTGRLPMTSPAPTGYTLTAPVAREYQICFKCHSSYAFGSSPPTSSSGAPETDAAAEFNPNNRSYHPVAGPPHLRSAASALLAPWNTTSAAARMYCSDCHGNNETTSATVPAGPHGSTNPSLLQFASATWTTTSPTISAPTGFCFNCHSAARIREVSNVHGVGDHGQRPCQACHVAVPHGLFRVGLIALSSDPAPYNKGAARITAFTAAATAAGYQKSSCSTLSGCH